MVKDNKNGCILQPAKGSTLADYEKQCTKFYIETRHCLYFPEGSKLWNARHGSTPIIPAMLEGLVGGSQTEASLGKKCEAL
jgi:hypothetical protein